MSGRRDALERIAAALERLSPPPAEPTNWGSSPAYIWDGERALAVPQLEALPLDVIRGVERQKAAIRDHLDRHSRGAAAHDMLLWGARGMGKSALVKAAVADVQASSLHKVALVQVLPETLISVPKLFNELAKQDRMFLVFVDDLGFDQGQNREVLALRSLLDGGTMARPANVLFAVTANRRSILARDGSESQALHERDERDDALALADRFGLTLGFHPCGRETYLEILRAYTVPLDLEFDEEEALAWAIARGNRSGRIAFQYATELAGRAGLVLKVSIP